MLSKAATITQPGRHLVTPPLGQCPASAQSRTTQPQLCRFG